MVLYLTPGNTPAVSCSLLQLKHALITSIAAIKGKIEVDFEVVEFTHQFCFQVCGIELWASVALKSVAIVKYLLDSQLNCIYLQHAIGPNRNTACSKMEENFTV